MSISPIDNTLLPLGPLSQPFEAREAVLEQPAALEPSSTVVDAVADAQTLLAQDVWPDGPRLFNIPELANGSVAGPSDPPNGDELERIATEVTSFLS
jgi:hypothetical protein